MASESRGRRSSNVQYIYDLPYFERRELCRILDVNSKWELLAGVHMHYSILDIQELKRQERIGNSPTDQLLNSWGSQNHTIRELFVLLYKIKHHQAMMVLKPFVDSKCQSLLYEGEGSVTKMLEPDIAGATSSEVNGAAGPSPNAPSPSSALDKTLGVSKRNIDNASQATAMPGPSHKTGFSELLHPTIKIQNDTPYSDEMNIHESSLDGNQVQGNTFEQTPGPSGLTQHPISVPRRLSSPTGNASPVLLIPAPHFPGSQSPKPEGERENLSPNLSRSPSQASNVEGRSPTAQRKSSCELRKDDLPHISYKELEIATGGWDKNNILGSGGFGTVFKGVWKHTEVAVKRLELRKEVSAESQEVQKQQWLREMRILRSSPHDNILPLYGYSMGGDQPCLVYKYMAGGSLEDRLLRRGGTLVLDWVKRINIAIGTARGLQFLHTSHTPLIHGDIKSANILLDSTLEPLIGDFGLAREKPVSSETTSVMVSRVQGTRPYLPDDFLRTKKLSTKVDTYSFGVVLYELATGQRAFDDKRPEKYLKDHVEKTPGDEQVKQLPDKWLPVVIPDLFLTLLDIGKVCTKKLAKDRPEMEVVLKDLLNRKKTYEMRRQALACADTLRNPMYTNFPLQQLSTPFQNQVVYDNINTRRSFPHGSNFPISPGGSVSPVFGVPNSGMNPTGGVPGSNLVSGLPNFSGYHHANAHQGSFSPATPFNRGSYILSQDVNSPPALAPVPAQPQNSLQRWDVVPPSYPELQNPAIAVMPPTLSTLLPSKDESYCVAETSKCSHAPTFPAAPPKVETENTDSTNPGNVPLLSILGKEVSDVNVEERSEQLSSNDTNSSSGSISNNIDVSTSNTNNNNSTGNSVTVQSCRTISGSNSEPVLPNLQSLAITPVTQKTA